MKLTGAQIVWEMLKREGVDVVFGITGAAIMHTYHYRQAYNVHNVLMRHEQCAAHAADGYARVSGKVGVAMTTSGPGATNLVTGIATAYMDSSPIVCITGQVPSSLIGTDAFQEIDITGITLPITKHNYLVTDVDDLARTIHEAFHIARSGRPGPVLIDLPKDVQVAEADSGSVDFIPPEGDVKMPGYHPVGPGDPELVQKTAEIINAARRPVILAGHGVMMSGAMAALQAFAEKSAIPVCWTLLGKGCFPPSHPLGLAMMGMHGEAFVNQAIQEADLLLAFGMRFSDRVIGQPSRYAPNACKIHVDLDAAELNKIVPVDVAILGDLRQVLEQLLPQVEENSRAEWLAQIDEWRGESHARNIINRPANGHLTAPQFIHAIHEATRGQAILVTDVGQHQMWAAQYYHNQQPNTLVTSGGLGTMGFGLPAAIGAQVARPDREVWAILGDGGFQMTMHDLATIAHERLPIKIALSNNNYLGMVRQWQELFYEKRYEATHLQGNPDFAKLAQLYGIHSWTATDPVEASSAIDEARAHPGPAFIDFQVVQEGDEGNVYPMVPAGAALHEMIRRPVPTQALSPA
ncbi:MAG: biosynthetic-type acetolactate synthase large subunit [Anaerolineae bacterium]|nr:biosynthetic-type acetolactate synthase large subunit [Anaerolineae bacterium]